MKALQRKCRPSTALISLLFAVSAGIAAPSLAADGAAPAHSASGGMHSDMHQQMMQNMQKMQSMQSTGDVDRDFATMMRQHHQGGIEMAQYELKHGKDKKMRQMAEKIINTQEKEIAEFDRWLAGDKSPGKGNQPADKGADQHKH